MKSVGQQLQEARLAKNWTPELAARETKIKADRVRDLEADDYTNFSSPTYARGFVRTYARALGLDEYRILRQLDNKLPEDDNASFATENGSMPYVPEPSTQAMHVSSAPRTGLYVVLGMGCGVLAIAAFVLLQAYRSGELPRYFASTGTPDNSTNAAAAVPPIVDSDAPRPALPVDPNDTTHSVRALPVDLNALAATPDTNAAPVSTNPTTASQPAAPLASTETPAPAAEVPVAPSTSGMPADAPPVSASMAAPAPSASQPAPSYAPTVAPVTESTPKSATAAPAATEANAEGPSLRALPVDPSELVAANQTPPEGPINPSAIPAPAPDTSAPTTSTPVDLGPKAMPVDLPADAQPAKRLVLTASRDSFIRVTSLDSPSGKEVLYASILRSGQSLEFDGRKFSVNVANPSAVDIMLDGVNYGPHSDRESPETFTLQSHQQ